MTRLARTPTALLLGATATLATLVGACQRSPGGRRGDSGGDGGAAGSVAHPLGARVSAVRLERQPCYGTCPVYVLDVDSAGRVQFQGRAHVRVVGDASATVAKQAFRDMTNQLMESGFASFRSSYVGGAEGCGDYMTDQPIVVLSAVIDGTPKKVVHDYGCSGAPRVLRRLHRMVDSVANTSRWLLDS
jgi:hypothetical protein